MNIQITQKLEQYKAEIDDKLNALDTLIQSKQHELRESVSHNASDDSDEEIDLKKEIKGSMQKMFKTQLKSFVE